MGRGVREGNKGAIVASALLYQETMLHSKTLVALFYRPWCMLGECVAAMFGEGATRVTIANASEQPAHFLLTQKQYKRASDRLSCCQFIAWLFEYHHRKNVKARQNASKSFPRFEARSLGGRRRSFAIYAASPDNSHLLKSSSNRFDSVVNQSLCQQRSHAAPQNTIAPSLVIIPKLENIVFAYPVLLKRVASGRLPFER